MEVWAKLGESTAGGEGVKEQYYWTLPRGGAMREKSPTAAGDVASDKEGRPA